jgi:hypothetical protein
MADLVVRANGYWIGMLANTSMENASHRAFFARMDSRSAGITVLKYIDTIGFTL